MRFTAEALPPDPNRPILLDSIRFSSVPEPGVLALGGLGALLLGARLWKKRRRARLC